MTGRIGRIALLAVLALAAAAPAVARKAPKPAALPRLVDLGAQKCIPCKRMAPILEALKVDYAGVADVEFIDVWKNPQAGKAHGIRLIPTQIFFDRTGRERFRHEGFFSREDIEKVFQEKMGVKPVPPSQRKEEKKTSQQTLEHSPGESR